MERRMLPSASVLIKKTRLLVPVLWVAGLVAGPFEGVWEAKINDLPGIELTVQQDSGGKPQGDIIFYFQRRGADGKWRVEGEPAKQPLISPNGPNKKYKLELTAKNELTFVDEKGPGIKL